MKLLQELVEQVEIIKEEKDGKKDFYLNGIFLQSAIANRNKRIYPTEVLQREATRYLKENIDRRTAWGELNHPSGPNINLDRVCLRTTKLEQNGNNFVGKALVTPTPMGDIVKGLVESGGQLGVSSRALGSLKPLKDELNEVQDDLRLLAIDCVGDPSAPDAWVDGIMENIEYFYNNRTGEIAEEARNTIKGLTSRQIAEQKFKLFEDFLSKLRKS